MAWHLWTGSGRPRPSPIQLSILYSCNYTYGMDQIEVPVQNSRNDGKA